MISVAFIIPPLLLFCYCIGKIYAYYMKKRSFFLKLGEELEQKSVTETKTMQVSKCEDISCIEKRIGENIPSIENYIEICHQNYLKMSCNNKNYQN